jgi:uncharacterized protein (TIGR02246 family)
MAELSRRDRRANARLARSPHECEEAFVACLNSGDLEGLMALYEPGASHVREDGTVAVGHDAIREVMERFIAQRPQLRSEVETVIYGGDEIAVVTDSWQLRTTTNGEELDLAGSGMHVIRSREGGWRFLVSGLTNL